MGVSLHRFSATKKLVQLAGDLPIVSNLGPTSDDLWHAGHRNRNFYTYGSMGLCSSFALGVALATSEKVISLDGDGSLLMNMGTIATLARESPPNLVVIVWDNEQWAQTGGQPSHTAFNTDLERVARACGIKRTATVDHEDELTTIFRQSLNESGPWFIVAKIVEDGYLPVAPVEPELTVYRFRNTFIGRAVKNGD